MTTDELLDKLPSHIGNHKVGDFYVMSKPEDDIGWLYLHNDGKDWLASYGIEGEFVCMGQLPNGLYDNAFAYGKQQMKHYKTYIIGALIMILTLNFVLKNMYLLMVHHLV